MLFLKLIWKSLLFITDLIEGYLRTIVSLFNFILNLSSYSLNEIASLPYEFKIVDLKLASKSSKYLLSE